MSLAASPIKIVEKHGVMIMGYSNTPAHLAADTSALFSRNLFNFPIRLLG